MTVLLSLALLLALLQSAQSLKTVFIIRHCDELDDSNPCCSLFGYERAGNWNRLFDGALQGQNVTIYSPGAKYDSTTVCKPNIAITNTATCQKSQRMAMTARIIRYNLNSYADMEMNYCSGEYAQVVSDITKAAKTVENALVVWKHSEIVNMINLWNVPLTPWPTTLDERFDLVFQLTFASNTDTNPTLSYNCFDFQNNVLQCDAAVQEWLQSYPTFSVVLPVMK